MKEDLYKDEPAGFDGLRGAFRNRPQSDLPPFVSEWVTAEPRNAVPMAEIRDARPMKPILAAAAVFFLILTAGIVVVLKSRADGEGRTAGTTPARAVAAMVTGKADLFHDGKAVALNTGTMVVEGDKIVTSTGASVDLGLPGGHMIRIKESSQFQMKVLRSRPEGGREVFANLLSGETVVSGRKLGAGEQLTIGTPTAIAGVRGTGFTVQTDGRQTMVSVAEGRVEVAEADASNGKVVEANQGVIITETGKRVDADPGLVQKTLTDLKQIEQVRTTFDEEALQAAQELAVVKSDADIARVYNRDPETIRMKNGTVYRGVVASQTGAKLLVVTVQGSYIVDKGDILDILVEGSEK